MNNVKLIAHSIKAPPDEFAPSKEAEQTHTPRRFKAHPFSTPHLFKCASARTSAKTAFTKLHLSSILKCLIWWQVQTDTRFYEAAPSVITVNLYTCRPMASGNQLTNLLRFNCQSSLRHLSRRCVVRANCVEIISRAAIFMPLCSLY